ncbi:hypothetical protein HHK36_030013 [Tetracentron sinense]|uniref:PB1 domain-containing protein n=1 Tax=Tetracentron sinense TaxID=13715 RepID=A0A834YCD2_TETSI|nr:hypothetical protein HHK36_030013 [Tetracentron sinense]
MEQPPPAGSDSVESSPRSRNTDSWDDSIPPLPSAKLRLMCSYGGHIVPRPHDKSLCYLGGHTRIVVADRHSSLAQLSTRLSRSLLNDLPFSLKYQLPNEDLDSLISVTTDEDLENMIEEYDRTSSSLKPSRIRLFLFPFNPDSASSMGSLKSETWFVDALNGVDAQTESLIGNKEVKHGQDVHSVPDSLVLETTSSFGSSSSSPSLSNLPPIGVRLQDQKVGLEEHFSQMGVSADADTQKQDEGFVVQSSSPNLFPTGIAAATVVSSGVSENPIRSFSDDEISEQGVLPKLPHLQQKPNVGLPSPDSIASDTSISNSNSAPKPVFYQDPSVHVASLYNKVSANPIDPWSNISDQTSRIKMQQVQDSGYILHPQLDQQQQHPQQRFIQSVPHYIHHHATGPAPISSYYPMYPQPQQQQQYQLDQQYPIYYLPLRQTQPYNLSTHSNLGDTATMASSRPPMAQNPAMIPPSAAYKEPAAPIYPTGPAPPPKPELAASMYRTATSTAPPLIHLPSTQHQPQYMVFPQMHHPSQSIAASSANTANYAYEVTDPAHSQIYYTQPPAATLPPQP